MNEENVIIKTEQESANNLTSINKEDIQILKNEVHSELEEIREIKQILIKREESFSGPLPHPDHFRKYNQIVPGSANRLLKMAEDDLKHIHDMQKSQDFTNKMATLSGLFAGWSIAMVCLIGSGYLIMNDHDVAGAVLGAGALTSLVSVFVVGKKINKTK